MEHVLSHELFVTEVFSYQRPLQSVRITCTLTYKVGLEAQVLFGIQVQYPRSRYIVGLEALEVVVEENLTQCTSGTAYRHTYFPDDFSTFVVRPHVLVGILVTGNHLVYVRQAVVIAFNHLRCILLGIFPILHVQSYASAQCIYGEFAEIRSAVELAVEIFFQFQIVGSSVQIVQYNW